MSFDKIIKFKYLVSQITQFERLIKSKARTVPFLKFIYSEKATKFCEIFPLLLSTVHTVKIKGKISQNFVTFSEYMNFNIWIMYFNITNVPDVFVKDQNLAKTLIGLLKHGFLRNVSNFCSSYLNNILSKSRKFWVCVDFEETEMWMSSTVLFLWTKFGSNTEKHLPSHSVS